MNVGESMCCIFAKIDGGWSDKDSAEREHPHAFASSKSILQWNLIFVVCPFVG